MPAAWWEAFDAAARTQDSELAQRHAEADRHFQQIISQQKMAYEMDPSSPQNQLTQAHADYYKQLPQKEEDRHKEAMQREDRLSYGMGLQNYATRGVSPGVVAAGLPPDLSKKFLDEALQTALEEHKTRTDAYNTNRATREPLEKQLQQAESIKKMAESFSDKGLADYMDMPGAAEGIAGGTFKIPEQSKFADAIKHADKIIDELKGKMPEPIAPPGPEPNIHNIMHLTPDQLGKQKDAAFKQSLAEKEVARKVERDAELKREAQAREKLADFNATLAEKKWTQQFQMEEGKLKQGEKALTIKERLEKAQAAHYAAQDVTNKVRADADMLRAKNDKERLSPDFMQRKARYENDLRTHFGENAELRKETANLYRMQVKFSAAKDAAVSDIKRFVPTFTEGMDPEALRTATTDPNSKYYISKLDHGSATRFAKALGEYNKSRELLKQTETQLSSAKATLEAGNGMLEYLTGSGRTGSSGKVTAPSTDHRKAINERYGLPD
jgi:hypothetical protein